MKKAQASIFMIVAVILIVGGGIFYYTTRNQGVSDSQIKISNEQIPFEFEPVRNFVIECLESTSIEALDLIGEHGGYVSFSDKSLNQENFIVTNEPTESEAVAFTRGSENKIAYWHYLKSSNRCTNDCTFASKRPDLRQADNSVEKQLERYIDANLRHCLAIEDFNAIGYDVEEIKASKTDVAITQNDVVVTSQFPITVKRGLVTSELSQFSTRIPINLAGVYDLSTKITNLQIKHHFIEKHALNLIAAFSGTDKEKLPPMSDMKFEFGNSLSWQKTDVKNKVTGLLVSYVPLFRVDGTRNFERNYFSSELKQRLYDSTIIPAANISYSNLEAQFNYLDFWPAYFDLNCKGEHCTPSSASSFFSFFGIQDYKFNYDISFPVLIEIKDPDALNGRGYTLNFFLEGNIRNNNPMDSGFFQLELEPISGQSQLCDVRASSDVDVAVVNAATNAPIENAQVIYSVAGEECFIGSTQNGRIIDKFPVGLGGYITAIADNYIGKSIEFDAEVGKSSYVNLELEPITTKKLIVRKKNFVKTAGTWNFVDSAVDLDDNEKATVTVSRHSDNEFEFSGAAESGSDSEIEIAAGNYYLDALLIANERVVIPARRECKKIVGGLFGEECFDIPQVDLGEGLEPGSEQFTSGGARLNFTVSAEDLKKDSLVIYVMNFDLSSVPLQDRNIEDLNQIGKVDEYSNTNMHALMPTWE